MSSLTAICRSPQLASRFHSGVTRKTQCAVVTKRKCSCFCSEPQMNAGMRACACTTSNCSDAISFFSAARQRSTASGFFVCSGSVTWRMPAASSMSE